MIPQYRINNKTKQHTQRDTKFSFKRDLHICQKRHTHMSKDTYITCLLTESHSFSLERKRQIRSVKRDLHVRQKSHTYMSKDTYIYMSLDRESLFLSRERVTKETCQKRLTVTKETCQKRHTYRSKETYIYVKRHLYIYVS